MIWLILVFVSALSWALSTLFKRVFMKEEESDHYAYVIVFQLLIALLMFLYTLFFGFRLPALRPIAWNLVLMTLIYALAPIAFFKGLKTVEASESAILVASRSIWVTVAAIFFLQEGLSVNKVLGTVLVVLGISISFWKNKKWKLNKGHVLILISALLFGLAFTNDAFILNTMEAASFSVLAFSFPAVALLLIKPKSIKNFSYILNKKRFPKMLGASIFHGIATLAIYSAYRYGGEASQIVPISQIAIIFTVIFGYLFLRERKNILQKVIGSIIVFLGVLFLI